MNKKYYILAIFSALLFSLSTPASKLLLDKINPIFLAALYYLGAAVFLLPFSYKDLSREYKCLREQKKDFFRLLGAVIFGGIIGPLCLLFGIKSLNATSSSLLLNIETVATTFLAWLFFREHISRRVAISSILTVVAGILLVLKSDFQINYGGLLIVFACIAWGLDNNFTATVEGISPKTNTIIKGTLAGFFNLIIAFLFYKIEASFVSIAFAVVIGFFSYGLSISLYITSARYFGAARSQIVFSIHPFLGAIISYFIFWDNPDETLDIVFIYKFELYPDKQKDYFYYKKILLRNLG